MATMDLKILQTVEAKIVKEIGEISRCLYKFGIVWWRTDST